MTTPPRPDPSPVDTRADPSPRQATAADESATFDERPGDGSNATVSFPPPPPPEPSGELTGQLGRYQILQRLGKGGMGRVYLARDTGLDRLVALKVPQLDGGDRALLRERFYREARAAATLCHPNICPVHDVGCIDDIPYLTMAYIDGPTLQGWAAESRPLPELLRVIERVALALQEAHQHGVVHRDLKPSNVMIDRRGEPVVMDFGLARRLDLPDEARLTAPGLLMGTPAYLPPECVEGSHDAGPAADVYSLGVILYELLAGRCPYVGSVMSIITQILHAPPEPPSRWRPDLDPRLDALCLRALAREPHQRYGSMAEFARTVAAVLAAPPAPRTDPPPASPSSPASPPDPAVAPRILELLRTWGGARAAHKMRTRAQRNTDPAQRAAYLGFLDWMAGERTNEAVAMQALQRLPCGNALRGWALVGQAWQRQRDRDYTTATRQLDRAESEGDPSDRMLQATIAHARATILVHLGRSDQALPHLHRALDLFGRDHFMTGRVLDTLGMAYAYKGSFPIAREFYQHSMQLKEAVGDEAGLAISHGQLGRLYLDWGDLDAAERSFEADLRLVQKLRSRWSEAQICNHLGQVALARASVDAASGRKAPARRAYQTAAGWLDASIRQSQEGAFAILEAFARKDRALCCLGEGDLNEAWTQVRRAVELFAAASFAEGTAKAGLIEGMLLRRQEQWTEAERKFRAALGHFETTQQTPETVQALWEIARTLRDSGVPRPLVTRAYQEALRRAEKMRHDHLVRGIEQELHEVDVEAYLRHVYRRSRGADLDEDEAVLREGISEVGTVVWVDLPGFAEVAGGLTPQDILLTCNHLLGDLADVLTAQGARILTYRGNGLLALTRDVRHAERAVRAGLHLVAAVQELNRPRQLLGLTPFRLRVGIASGDLLLGNVGTYHKMEFTALGAPVALAAALAAVDVDRPCLDRATCEQVRGGFRFDPASPRRVALDGPGEAEGWDVLAEISSAQGRKK